MYLVHAKWLANPQQFPEQGVSTGGFELADKLYEVHDALGDGVESCTVYVL
jgi:hypothetical protein